MSINLPVLLCTKEDTDTVHMVSGKKIIFRNMPYMTWSTTLKRLILDRLGNKSPRQDGVRNTDISSIHDDMFIITARVDQSRYYTDGELELTIDSVNNSKCEMDMHTVFIDKDGHYVLNGYWE